MTDITNEFTVYTQSVEIFLDNHMSMIHDHYDEVPMGSRRFELDLDYELYYTLEEAGNLKIYMVGDETTPAIGYMIIMATPLPHHKGKMAAITDCFYIVPEYRRSGAMHTLVDAVKKDLSLVGIDQFNITANVNFKGAEAMAKALGMVELETTYTFELGE